METLGTRLLHWANLSLSYAWHDDRPQPLFAGIVWRMRRFIPNTYFK